MIRSTATDPKIDRIQDSWLGLCREDAVWLASVADEVDAAGGTRVGHDRFTHVVLTGADAGVVVDAGAPPIVLRGPAAVLVLTTHDAARLSDARSRTAAGSPLTARAVPMTRWSGRSV